MSDRRDRDLDHDRDRDARLAEAFRRGSTDGAGAGGGAGAWARDGACPPDDRIWEAARGTLPPDELPALLDHVHRCAACEESFRMARALAVEETAAAEGMPAADEAPASSTARPLARRPEVWALAAAALLLVAATVLWTARDGGTADPWDAPSGPPPSGPDASALRDPAAGTPSTPLADGTALPRGAFVLRWEGLPDGAIATVELADGDLRLLHRAEEVTGGAVRIPPAALDDLPDGATLYWRVEAVLPDGRRVESPGFRVRIEG